MLATLYESLQPLSPLACAGVMLAAFTVSSIMLFPLGALLIVVGLVYGVSGIPLAILSATIAGCIHVLTARTLLSNAAAKITHRYKVARIVDQAITSEGWRVVLLLRLSVLPFGVQNYILSATQLRLHSFAVGTCAGLALPVSFWVSAGATGKGALNSPEANHALTLLLGLIALGGAVTILGLKARRMLQAADQ